MVWKSFNVLMSLTKKCKESVGSFNWRSPGSARIGNETASVLPPRRAVALKGGRAAGPVVLGRVADLHVEGERK